MIVREVDEVGRFVIPREMRKVLGIEKDTPVGIVIEGDHLVLQKIKETCKICGTAKSLQKYSTFYLCHDCLQEIMRGAQQEDI